jgi:hypothetical protein
LAICQNPIEKSGNFFRKCFNFLEKFGDHRKKHTHTHTHILATLKMNLATQKKTPSGDWGVGFLIMA